MELLTKRLWLRRFTPRDLDPVADMNADPVVMELTGPTLSHQESADLIRRILVGWVNNGFGLFAAEIRSTAELAGWIGSRRQRARSRC